MGMYWYLALTHCIRVGRFARMYTTHLVTGPCASIPAARIPLYFSGQGHHCYRAVCSISSSLPLFPQERFRALIDVDDVQRISR